MNIYIIADTHFSHKNIIEYCNRPYKDTFKMNNDIIEKWNNTVTSDDIVIHLGDVGFGLVEQLQPIVKSLKGYKILIRGNHDVKRGIDSWKNIGFDEVYKKKEISINELIKDITFDTDYDDIIFSHSPRQVEDNILNIHGHIHNVPLDITLYNPNNHFCASVEMIEYTPILLTDILKQKTRYREE